MPGQVAHHAVGDFAGVKSVAAMLGDMLQGLGQGGVGHDLAHAGGLAIQQIMLCPTFVGSEQRFACRPIMGNPRCGRHALFGQGNCWRQSLSQRHRSMFG